MKLDREVLLRTGVAAAAAVTLGLQVFDKPVSARQIQPIPGNCNSLLQPNLQIGQEAEIVIPSLDVRDNNLNVDGQLKQNETVNIIEGPNCFLTSEGSFNFYETDKGYLPDADNSQYFLQPQNTNREAVATPIIPDTEGQQPRDVGCPAVREGNLLVMIQNEPQIPHVTNSKLENIYNAIVKSHADLGAPHYSEIVLGFYTNEDDLTKATGFNLGHAWQSIHSFRTAIYHWSDQKCSEDDTSRTGVNFIAVKIPYSLNSNSNDLPAIYFELIEREFANTVPGVDDGPIANTEEEIGRAAYLQRCGSLNSVSRNECREVYNIIYSS